MCKSKKFVRTFPIKTIFVFLLFKQRRGVGQSEEQKFLTYSLKNYIVQKLEKKMEILMDKKRYNLKNNRL